MNSSKCQNQKTVIHVCEKERFVIRKYGKCGSYKDNGDLDTTTKDIPSPSPTSSPSHSLSPAQDDERFKRYLNSWFDDCLNCWVKSVNSTDLMKAWTSPQAIKDNATWNKILSTYFIWYFEKCNQNDIKNEVEFLNYIAKTLLSSASSFTDTSTVSSAVKACVNRIVNKISSSTSNINTEEILDLPYEWINKITRKYFLRVLNTMTPRSNASRIAFHNYMNTLCVQYQIHNNNIFHLLRTIKRRSSKEIKQKAGTSSTTSPDIEWEIEDSHWANSFYRWSKVFDLKYFSLILFVFYNKDIDQLSFAFQIIKNSTYFLTPFTTLCIWTNSKLMHVKKTNTIENNSLTEGKTNLSLIHSLSNDKVWFYKVENFSRIVHDVPVDSACWNESDCHWLLQLNIDLSIEYSCVFSYICWHFYRYFDDDNISYLSKSELKILVNSPDLVLDQGDTKAAKSNANAKSNGNDMQMPIPWKCQLYHQVNKYLNCFIYNTIQYITKYQTIINYSKTFENLILSRFHQEMLTEYSHPGNQSKQFSKKIACKIINLNIKHTNNQRNSTDKTSTTSRNSMSCLSLQCFPNMKPTDTILQSRNSFSNRSNTKRTPFQTHPNEMKNHSINSPIRKNILTTNNTSANINVVNSSIHSTSTEKFVYNYNNNDTSQDINNAESGGIKEISIGDNAGTPGITNLRKQINKIEKLIYENKINKRYNPRNKRVGKDKKK